MASDVDIQISNCASQLNVTHIKQSQLFVNSEKFSLFMVNGRADAAI